MFGVRDGRAEYISAISTMYSWTNAVRKWTGLESVECGDPPHRCPPDFGTLPPLDSPSPPGSMSQNEREPELLPLMTLGWNRNLSGLLAVIYIIGAFAERGAEAGGKGVLPIFFVRFGRRRMLIG